MIDSSNENKSIISIGSNLHNEEITTDEETPFILSSSLKIHDENDESALNKVFKFVGLSTTMSQSTERFKTFDRKFSKELDKRPKIYFLQSQSKVNKYKYIKYRQLARKDRKQTPFSVFNLATLFWDFSETSKF